MNYTIALIGGDGIGPEVAGAAVRVLEKIGDLYGHTFTFKPVLAGGAAIDATGEPLPKQSVQTCKECDAALLGAVGGPQWDTLPGDKRPEKAILGLRKELGLFTNLRPASLFTALAADSPLRADIAEKGFDLLIVRELTGGLYYGKRGREGTGADETAFDTETYSRPEIERIGVKAFELAKKRQKRLVSVDKANVLDSSRLWREIMQDLSKKYPEVAYSDMLVDNAAMQLIRNPAQFDVMVMSNLFGDILSDEASALTASIGMLPSASMGDGSFGLYEPIHGSAPDIAGQGKSNPIAAILSAAMMLNYSFSLAEEAVCIEKAVCETLNSGLRTPDIAGGNPSVSTAVMTEKILTEIDRG